MEDKYTDKVFKIMSSVYGDRFTLSPEDFENKLDTSDEYRSKVYDILGNVYGDKFTVSEEEWPNKVKKKEEIITEDLQTPAEPSIESGEVVEERVTETVDEAEGVNLYTVNDTPVTKEDIVKNIENPEFIQKIQSGELNVKITDDPILQEALKERVDLSADNNKQRIESEVMSYMKSQYPAFSLGAEIWGTLKSTAESAVGGIVSTAADISTPKAWSDEKIQEFRASGREDLAESLEAQNKASKELRNDLFAWGNNLIEQSGKTKKQFQTTSSITDIRDPLDAVNYALNSVVEMGIQVPLTFFSGGTSSFGQTYGPLIIEQAKKISKEQGITLEEALDSPEIDRTTAAITGIAVTALDRVGAGAVLGGKAKTTIAKSLIERAKQVIKSPTAIEVSTELAQTFMEKIGGAIGVGEDIWEALSETPATEWIDIIIKSAIGAKSINTFSKSINDYSTKRKATKESIELVTAAGTNVDIMAEAKSAIIGKVIGGEITQEEGIEAISNLESDAGVSNGIPDNIKGENRVKALELLKIFNKIKEDQNKADDAFKPLFKPELDALTSELEKLFKTKFESTETPAAEVVVDEENTVDKLFDKRVKSTSDKFDAAINKAIDKYGDNSNRVSELKQEKEKAIEELNKKRKKKLAIKKDSKVPADKQLETEDLSLDDLNISDEELLDLEEDINIEEKTQELPEVKEQGKIEDGGKTYEIISVDKKKDGSKVVKAKEVIDVTKDNIEELQSNRKASLKIGDKVYGTTKRYTGQTAEQIAKDNALGEFKERTPKPKKRKFKGRAQPPAPVVPTPTVSTKIKPDIEERTEESIDKELREEIERIEKDTEEFIEAVLDELVSSSKDKDVITSKGNLYLVTKKPDGTYSVSKMRRSDNKFIGLRKDTEERKLAISNFKRKKTKEENKKLSEAEKLIEDTKKESEKTILEKIEIAIENTSFKTLRGQANDIVTVLGYTLANLTLKGIRASIKAGLSLKNAIALQYDKIKATGVSELEFKRFILETLKKQPKKVTEETPAAEVVVDEESNPVIVYRGGKPTEGIQYYTDDQKRAAEIAEAKGEPVSEGMNVAITNAWTPESLDINNPPEWLVKWVKANDLDVVVDDDMVPTERPMSEVMQEIKDVRLSFKDTKLWQSFVTETLKHHDGIIAIDPSEALAEGKKIYITKSPEQIKSIPSKETKQPGAKKPLEKQPTSKTKKERRKVDKIIVDEYAALKDQIKLESRAARGATIELNKRRKELSNQIKELKRKGKITTNQAQVIINKINSVNLYNPKKVSEFISYMDNIYRNAELADKIISANKIRKKIKKASRTSKVDNSLVNLAKDFAKIDIKNINNIDEYIDIANSVLDGITESKFGKEGMEWSSSPNINKTNEYIKDKIEAQEKNNLERKREIFEEATGIVAEDLSYDDMILMLDPKKDVSDSKERLIRSGAQKAFDNYKGIIKEMLKGNDPFNELENIEIENKNLIRDFINMDITKLGVKESIMAVDALNNFIVNQSTGGMQKVVNNYKGADNVLKLVAEKIKALPIKLFGSNAIGRLEAKEIMTLPLVFEFMFKSQARARAVAEALGVSDIIYGNNKSKKQANNVLNNYLEKFSKSKPNGKSFNDVSNIVERGLIGFMRRTLIGTKGEKLIEFTRRKKLIKQTITDLSLGNSKDKIKADEYKEVYDAVLKDVDSIESLDEKVDKTNLEAVKWWNNEWKILYPKLADVSLNIYNKVLVAEVNYIPDALRLLDKKEDTEFNWDDSAFANSDKNVYQKKSGVLQEVERPSTLKDRYVSLDFDTNNISILESALVDVNTASGIQQLKGAIESDGFKKLIPQKEDRDLLTDRLKGYVKRIRGKDFIGSKNAEILKMTNAIAGLAVSRTLGGITQPLKQVVPVALNTLVTAGNLDVAMSKEMIEFINNSGYDIANRGLKSEVSLDNINRALEKEAKTKIKKIGNFIVDANKKYLNVFLSNPDAWIAKVAWITYYKKALKKKGVNTNNIDWSTHKVNKEAGNYAQQQVDRQQNVSDSELQGDFMTDKRPLAQVIRKTLIPFANFILNQKARMFSDIRNITSKTSSVQDKLSAARSLAGLSVEIATFNIVSYGIRNIIFNIAAEIMGYDESEEEEEKRRKTGEKIIRTNIVTDLLSPFPMFDPLVLTAINKALPEDLDVYDNEKQEWTQSLGIYGIGYELGTDLFETGKMAVTGELTKKFFGEETSYDLDDKSKEVMGAMTVVQTIYTLGALPSETGTLIRDIKKIANKKKESKSKKSNSMFTSPTNKKSNSMYSKP